MMSTTVVSLASPQHGTSPTQTAAERLKAEMSRIFGRYFPPSEQWITQLPTSPVSTTSASVSKLGNPEDIRDSLVSLDVKETSYTRSEFDTCSQANGARPIPTPLDEGETQAATRLLESWCTAEDEREQHETWAYLKTALEQDRPSSRKLLR